MNREYLSELKEKISGLSSEELKYRDLYLKQLAEGELYGPNVGIPNIDKPWLAYYSDNSILEDIPNTTLYDYVRKCCENRLDKVALKYFGNKITFRELFANIDKAAKLFLSKGVKPGDNVSIGLPSMPEVFYCFYALNSIGAVANFIDPRINEERIEEYIKTANSNMIICIDTYVDKFASVAEKFNLENNIVINASDSFPVPLKVAYRLKVKEKKYKNMLPWREFMKQSENLDIANNFVANGEEVAAIEYTSGTTGIPKGAKLSNKGLMSVAVQQKSVLPIMVEGDTFLDIMPPFIAYGLVCGMVTPLTIGMESTLIPKFDPADFDKLVMKHKPNHILGVPSFFEDLIKSNLVQKEDLSFLKYCIAGGDKMHVEAEKRINKFFEEHHVQSKIIKGYGMTELSSGVMINIDSDINKLGSVGVPLVKNNIKIVNPENNEELGYDEVGEVYITGPSKMVGYQKADSEMAKVFSEDSDKTIWVKTGDLGRVDSEGHVFIEGRLKRMIIRPDGHNVFPTAIENIVLTHPAVDKCFVVGMKTKEYVNGEVPIACVVLKDEYVSNADKVKKELTDLLSIKLPPRDVAQDYVFLEDMPMTSVGKVNECEIKDKVYKKLLK